MLPDGWSKQKLSDVCQFLNGRAYNKDELLDKGKYTVLRVGNFFTNENWYYSDLELEENKYCDNGDLLYAWSASFAPKIWNGGKVIYHYHIWKILTDINLVDKFYLYYFLEWDVENIKSSVGNGSTMIHITKGSIEQRPFYLPPLPEQKRIAEVLGSVDAAIEATKAVIDQTKTVKQGLLQTLLTRGIGHTKFKDSPLGEIPENWEVKGLGACFKNMDSRRRPVKREDRLKMSGNIPYYGASGIIDWVNTHLFDETLLLLAEDGANLLSKSTPLAFIAHGKTWVNNHAHIYQPTGVLDISIAEEWLCFTDIEPFITGSAQPKLNKDKADSIPMPVPPVAEQAEIRDIIQSVNSEISLEATKLVSLQTLKKGLMNDLLTGKVRVNV